MASRMTLYVALALLMLVSIIELSLISTMVVWLHGTASGSFAFKHDGSVFELRGQPKNFILDQGHTSNGAAGTAFFLIGIGGFIVLWVRNRPNPSKFALFLYRSWLVVNVLSLLLVLAALIYVFIVTFNHNGQTIKLNIATKLHGRHYPLESWTPQNWFSAVLKLNLAKDSVKTNISDYLLIMKGWQYNLIPFFIIHLVETTLALRDAAKRQKAPSYRSVQQKDQV